MNLHALLAVIKDLLWECTNFSSEFKQGQDLIAFIVGVGLTHLGLLGAFWVGSTLWSLPSTSLQSKSGVKHEWRQKHTHKPMKEKSLLIAEITTFKKS